jgi:hypothetical protein
MEATAILGSQ